MQVRKPQGVSPIPFYMHPATAAHLLNLARMHRAAREARRALWEQSRSNFEGGAK